MRLFGSIFSKSPVCGSSGSRTWTLVGEALSDCVSDHPDTILSREIDHHRELPVREGHSDLLGQVRSPAHIEEGSPAKGLLLHTGTDITKGASMKSSTDVQRSVTGSRRLAGFVTLLRPRKSRRRKSKLCTPEQPNTCAVGDANDRGNMCTVRNTIADHRSADVREVFRCYNNNPKEPYEERKASDRTMHSHTSDLTSVTVCHNPSKRASTPIALIHREHSRQNPFNEPVEPSDRLSSYNPFLEPSMTTTGSARRASSQYSDVNHDFAHIAGMVAKNENPLDYGAISLVSSSRTVSRDSTWSLHIDRHTAAVAFNELAPQIRLDPLVLSNCGEAGEELGSAVSALSTPDVFCNAGDLTMAARTYEYFADQVLSAEKVNDRIEITVRRGEMPVDLIGVLDHKASRKPSLQVLSVGWVFKALLAGLPGGILGSGELYRILVSICYGRIAEGGREPDSSCVGGLPPHGHTKIQAIGLAVLALTTPMQLNLICAFFGLCAMLAYETERANELEEPGDGVSSITPGQLSVERLGHILGPLLTPDGGEGGQDTFRAIEREIESQRVMTMLIGGWYMINRQLRVWQNQGSVLKQGAFSKIFSWEEGDRSREKIVG
ncbi:hypothetical protein BDV23DRAFT_176682 [Aspergillus alliaceus]|uniref:Uncharacterized protein n=1 Tax=Petromyces alliaceus TaxID=209559 RepID=A0A5N7BSX1_PETAA|nr:hypothetical protein BDV23DRAFT_176682 [Aspergillus alliaceus]